MKPLIRFAMMALVLVVVALVSALTAMRFAIHGQEVQVPAIVGMTPAEAERSVAGLGLQIEVERQYYSPQIPEGRIMTQMPHARNESAPRVAGAGSAEYRPAAGRDSGCHQAERTRRGMESSKTRTRSGFHGGNAVAGRLCRSGTGAESAGERQPGGCAKNKFTGDRSGRSCSPM